jgi:sugar phosphate isomerase/epimerase
MERFVNALREIGYTGSLNVEREIEDQQQRLSDIRAGLDLLRPLTSAKAPIS